VVVCSSGLLSPFLLAVRRKLGGRVGGALVWTIEHLGFDHSPVLVGQPNLSASWSSSVASPPSGAACSPAPYSLRRPVSQPERGYAACQCRLPHTRHTRASSVASGPQEVDFDRAARIHDARTDVRALERQNVARRNVQVCRGARQRDRCGGIGRGVGA